MQDRCRRVVAVADAGFCGVGWNHAMPRVVEKQSGQQVVGLIANGGAVRPLSEGRLVVERVAGKDYTTLTAIANMRLLCRVEPKGTVTVSSITDAATDRALAKLAKLRQGSRK
jgi:hypothetical protein